MGFGNGAEAISQMKPKALIGTFYKDLKKAKAKAKAMNKMWRHKSHIILSFPNGYLVVSKRQME